MAIHGGESRAGVLLGASGGRRSSPRTDRRLPAIESCIYTAAAKLAWSSNLAEYPSRPDLCWSHWDRDQFTSASGHPSVDIRECHPGVPG
jgi:hypothetical protein